MDSQKTSNSNYKKGKTNAWKAKSDEKANKSSGKNPEKSNGKNPNDKSGGKMKCNRCGGEHSGKPCWALTRHVINVARKATFNQYA